MMADNAGRVPNADELPLFGNRVVRMIIVDLNHMQFLKGQAAQSEANRGEPTLMTFEKGAWSFLQVKSLFDTIEQKYPRLKRAALIRQKGADPALSLAQLQILKKQIYNNFVLIKI